uniref:Peroxidase n=1 Tax=Fagus sylvatica TaxID=28930 RepID=A0A2N9IQY4_FAGSY
MINMVVGRVAIVTSFIFFLILHSSEAIIRGGNHLHVGFYSKTCPQAEIIVANAVYRAFNEDQGYAAGLIRLFFHDCFVNGCDASILLDSTPSGEPVEKKSKANGKTLRGLEVIDEIKALLEQECPGIVSCADILSFAAREAVVQSGLPSYRVPAGRRDGLSSRSADVLGNILAPSSPIDDIIQSFTRKGLTIEEMVVLLGAHSIGITHCKFFDYRLYNFSSTNTKDPSMNTEFANFLSWKCPCQGDISLDQKLASDPRTRPIVQRMAFDRITWSRKFARAMIQLGRVDVLTGSKGEIRENCRAVNQ